MKTKSLLSIALLGTILLAACASNKAVDVPQVKILETIPSIATPKWVNSTQDFWEEKGFYYYRGMAEGMTNLALAKRDAEAVARTSLAESVKDTIRNEFARALEGGAYDETTGGYIKDVFFSAVDNLTLSGVQIRESYIQRLLETATERVYYRSYVLSSISKKDFDKMVKNAFSATKEQVAANKSAKALAAETEARFWKQQEAEKTAE